MRRLSRASAVLAVWMASGVIAEGLRPIGSRAVFGQGVSIERPGLPTRGASTPIGWVVPAAGLALMGLLGVALFRESSRRRRAEMALAERDRRFRALLDGTDQFVGLLSADGTVLEANRPALISGGQGRDEVVGRRLCEVLGPSVDRPSRDRIREAVVRASSGAIERLEVEIRGGDDRMTTVDVSITPVRDESGRIVLLIPEGRDVSDRKRSERDLEQIIRQLEHSRAEAERQSAELAEARDRALAAVRAKGVFLANMSHEIRTPMTGILATADLLSKSRLDRDQREQVATIRSSGEALRAILDDILDRSKIEAGRMSLDPRPMDLRGLVEEVAGLMAPSAHRKGIRLLAPVAAEVPDRLVGDPMRLRQILLNLVGNAVKFTDRGEVVVEARVRGEGPQGVALEVSVRDTGIGIAPENFQRIFESFTQVPSPSRSPQVGGTGLGLAISRHLAHLMGGRIEVQSRVGQGSIFRLSLSLPTCPASQDDGGSGARSELVGLAVLVVMPEDPGRASVVELLRTWGCRPEPIDSVLLARSRLDRSPEDDRPRLLVVSDMAGASGDPLGSVPGLPRVVIRRAVSGWPEGMGPEALSVGEPVRRSTLEEAILQALRPGGGGAASVPIRERSGLPDLGLSVLLAEDHETNRALVGQMLGLLGCRVESVGDGSRAVEASATRRYDLILMDLELPILDGLQASVEIRRLELGSGHRTPIFALTAHVMEEDRRHCLEAGMDGFLTKPLRLETLGEFLSEFSGGRSRAPELSTS